MRQPTLPNEALQWWRDQLDGAGQRIIEQEPHAGYYKTRAYSHSKAGGRFKWPAPWIPGRIWLVQDIDFETGELTDDERFAAEIGQEKWNPTLAWLRLSGHPITATEWRWLKAQMPLLELPTGAIGTRR